MAKIVKVEVYLSDKGFKYLVREPIEVKETANSYVTTHWRVSKANFTTPKALWTRREDSIAYSVWCFDGQQQTTLTSLKHFVIEQVIEIMDKVKTMMSYIKPEDLSIVEAKNKKV